MKFFKTAYLAAVSILLPVLGKAQVTKVFSLVDMADNTTLTLQGDNTTSLTFRWTSADNKAAGASIKYTLQFDSVGGDFSNPPLLVGFACCSSFFNDTVAQFSQDFFADQLDDLYQTLYGKPFITGESVTLDWQVMANGIAPGPIYENRASQKRRITIVRGQFDQEYTPVKLDFPLDNSSFFVEDNDVVKLKFQWTKAYCPAGCPDPQYTIMFDSLNGDFSNPLYFYDVPVSPFDTVLNLRQDVLAQMMADDGIPVNKPKTYKWTVMAFGNGQQVYASPARRISLLRGLLKTEHVPFYHKTPVDNAVYKLEKSKTDSVVFSWSATRTGYPDQASYTVLFSDGVNFTFNNPVFRLTTGLGDTTFTTRYLALRDSLDKRYGTKWVAAQLKWTVQADVIGFKFWSEDTSDIRFARGFFTGVKEAESATVSVYPNPANETINVSSAQTIKTISVLDIAGREILKYSNESLLPVISLSISAWDAGIYFITTEQNTGGYTRPVKFIKQ